MCKVNIVHPNAAVEVLKLKFIPCFGFFKYKMMIFKYTLVFKEISINPYTDTSVCRSGNTIAVCKYGKPSCHCDCFIIRGMAN